MFSDGIFETEGESGARVKDRQLMTRIEAGAPEGACGVLECMLKPFDEIWDGKMREDDLTIVALTWKGESVAGEPEAEEWFGAVKGPTAMPMKRAVS